MILEGVGDYEGDRRIKKGGDSLGGRVIFDGEFGEVNDCGMKRRKVFSRIELRPSL